MHPLPLQDLWVTSADGMKTTMGSDDLVREHLEHLGINRVVICGDNVPWTATKVPTLRCSRGELGNRTCLRSGNRVPRSRNSHCLTTTVVVCGLPPAYASVGSLRNSSRTDESDEHLPGIGWATCTPAPAGGFVGGFVFVLRLCCLCCPELAVRSSLDPSWCPAKIERGPINVF